MTDFRKIFNKFLDFLLPESELVKRLKSTSPEELLKTARLPKYQIENNQIVIFDYQNPIIRRGIWEIKYRGNLEIISLFAKCAYEELIPELSERATFENFTNPLLVPIPISSKRRRGRGFNQCELLAEALCELDGGIFFNLGKNILIKTRHTENQTHKNRAERLKNLKGSFSVENSAEIADRNIILLDDVTTTGATLNEARRVLRSAGARKIITLAFAH